MSFSRLAVTLYTRCDAAVRVAATPRRRKFPRRLAARSGGEGVAATRARHRVACGLRALFALALIAFSLTRVTMQAAEELKESPPAQVAPPPAEPGPADLIPPGVGANSPSANVTINLIKRMVQKGLLTKEDAADLL